ncbi:hypothetical protein ACNS7O_07050 [Haloferacaceae archaeon DSL9]
MRSNNSGKLSYRRRGVLAAAGAVFVSGCVGNDAVRAVLGTPERAHPDTGPPESYDSLRLVRLTDLYRDQRQPLAGVIAAWDDVDRAWIETAAAARRPVRELDGARFDRDSSPRLHGLEVLSRIELDGSYYDLTVGEGPRVISIEITERAADSEMVEGDEVVELNASTGLSFDSPPSALDLSAVELPESLTEDEKRFVKRLVDDGPLELRSDDRHYPFVVIDLLDTLFRIGDRLYRVAATDLETDERVRTLELSAREGGPAPTLRFPPLSKPTRSAVSAALSTGVWHAETLPEPVSSFAARFDFLLTRDNLYRIAVSV